MKQDLYDNLWRKLDEAGFITGAWCGLALEELPDAEIEAFKKIVNNHERRKDGEKKEEGKTEAEAARPAAGGLGPDQDGDCLRCGLDWEGEKDENGNHVCPPGFWSPRSSFGGEYQTEFAGPKTEMRRRKQER